MLLTDNPSKYATLLAAVTKLLRTTQGGSVPAHRGSDTAKACSRGGNTQVNSKTILERTKDTKAHFKAFYYNKVYNKNISVSQKQLNKFYSNQYYQKT